jgi:hypothetical protein
MFYKIKYIQLYSAFSVKFILSTCRNIFSVSNSKMSKLSCFKIFPVTFALLNKDDNVCTF